ncbi:MAG: Hsp20/alpha crystallin family protein [candidate division NC10 bacterium]|nr:Hsp20/alpha crystallin family protein [candidate division NC10 bacterium]
MGKGWRSIALLFSKETGGEALDLPREEGSLWEKGPSSFHLPALDVYETPSAIWVELELPGVSPDRIRIHVTSGALVIQGLKEDLDVALKKRYHRAERVFGPFRRILTLPKAAIGAEAKASLDGGILKVVIPKRGQKVVISQGP